MKRSEAIYLRSIVEQAATSLDDKTASTAATLFPRLKGNGELVKAGTRICWNGTVTVKMGVTTAEEALAILTGGT